MSFLKPTQAASVAIFCPQSKAPDEAYLDQLRTFFVNHSQLRKLADAVQRLDETWNILAARRPDIAALHQGPKYLRALHNWVETGASKPVANAMSGILSLPLLVVIQTCQYFQYLRLAGLTHAEFLHGLKTGGAQGYCGGLLPAIAVACAKDEEEVVSMAGIAMRIALAVGAYGELGDDENLPGPTTIVLRLRHEGQGEDIARKFAGAYVSAVTDPKTISIVGPVPTLEKVTAYARELGLQAQGMHLRGKVHNPENAELARELCELCDGLESLTLPGCEDLQVPVYSNINGRQLQDCSLTHEAVLTILASRCEWWTLLNELASALKSTGVQAHTFAMFGIGDCVPLMPFHQARLKVSKIDIHRTIREAELREYTFPEDAIAIVGAACRLPGANNLEELWDLMAGGVSKAEEIRPDRIPLHASFRASQDQKFTSRRKFFGNFVDGVDGFDHTFFRTNPKEAAYMDPQQRILLELAYQAMDSSGYLRTHKRDNGDNIGCFIGASFNEYLDNTSAHAPTAYTSTGTIRAFLCGKISYYFGWSGPAEVIDTACSASLVAINRACRAIMSGECSMALAGGVNIMSGINNYMDLGKAGFLSPTGQCKPFDKNADGYCRADGAGLVVLKSLRHARADGDHILGVIPGVATNQGGLSASITVPHSPAQMTLYRRILKQAGMKAEQVSYVECHGTGTQAGDPLEIASVREVFCSGDRQGNLNVGSLKGNIGHCETAAGVASLLKVLAMLQKQRIPPLASFKSLNPKIPALAPDKMAVAKQVEDWDAPLRAACVNSYGAAGSNSALLCVEMKRGILGPLADGASTAKASAWPIVISAANKDSLSRYCHALDDHLGKTPNLSLGDLSFTLAERKQRHRFQLVATVSDLSSLRRVLTSRQLEASMIDVVNTTRPVVLAFGGQSKQTVGLDRGLYESSPRLRAYMQECNSILVDMGYSSILPAVFSSEPLADVVVLQTATFAVQYASAKCWTDAGVRVGAVIGHSFGELTALAFSGALSLRSGLKIVAARAKLMATKWGQERGTMLAIHAGRDVVEQVIRKVGGSELEVACYNAVASQVVVGSAAAVERAETLLASDAQFASVRSQRVDVSHGFHSKFTEPLLDELSTVAASLAFSEPKMALEMCVSDEKAKQSIGPSRIAQHTREPVYFVDAIRRIEARLGPRCVWLEAGTDAPIIPMVKRAVSQPAEHIFLGMRFAGAKDAAQVLPDVTTSLWREGLDVSFWPSLGGPAESGLSHVYLPPYEFVRTSAWVVNVDRALEARANTDAKATVQPDPPRSLLVTQQQPGSLTFTVNIDTKRFGDIVSGHAVRGRPLCPASMYMECAVMALQCHLGSRFDKACALSFENLTFEHPLGVDLSRHVEVVLSEAGQSGLWIFQLRSAPKSSATPRFSTHGRGKVRLGSPPQLQTFKHLVTECVEDVSNKDGTETLMSKRAYGLFSQVVTYAPLMRGIQSITMDGTRAVASIKVPTPHVAADDSSAIALCDTVSIDTFIQVVGLLINSSDACIPNHVFVATGVESATLSNACDFTAADSWTVYAVFRSTSETTATGDVFVMTKNGTMALNVMDVAFTRLPIATLEKLLDTANSTPAAKKETAPKRLAAPAVPSRGAVPELEAADDHQADSSSDSEDGIATPPGELDDSGLRKMIAMYTGVSVDAIATQSTMADLGVDSLAAVEFAEDLRSQFGKEIESMDLLSSDLNTLSKLCLTSIPKPQTKTKLTKANIAQIPPVMPVPASNGGRKRLVQIVSDACGAPISDIKDSHTLRDLGVDSLASVELSSDLENAFSVHIDESDVHLDCTIAEICSYLGIGEASVEPSAATLIQTSTPSSAHANSTPAAPQGNANVTHQRVLQIISDACGAPFEAMGDGELLRDLGVDSLAAVELKSELEDAFDVQLDDDLLDLSISETVKSCGGTTGPVSLSPTPNKTAASPTLPPKIPDIKPPPIPADMGSPFDSLVSNENDYTTKARRCGFQDFGTMVAPRQDELMLAYIVEAIAELGIDLKGLSEGAPLPPLAYRSKHAYDRLMQRVWVILAKHGLVNTISMSYRVRGSAKCPQSTSAELLLNMQKDFPAYRCEFALMNLTGSQLGQCLAGKQDPIALMFKTQEAQAIMEDFYLNSPMLATATEMLVDTIVDTVSRSNINNPINILEVGAGFGGTTRKLVQRLDRLGRSVSYTFTDISPTLVSRALKVFANQYPWLQFQTWNMEHTPSNALSATGPFDIIIGTNCVHATQDRMSTLNRLKQLLHPSGFLVLSEVTEIVDWYDITYGLLDSWWSDKDGSYPLQPADAWMRCFKDAGFAVASYSQGPNADLSIQRLLIASMRRDIQAPHRTPLRPVMETVVYKTADGVDIHADVFFPKQPLASAMPIALMIHGGGHMTLSRKAIRPAQTSFLLQNGLLPVSIDYRLCPEVNLIDGPIADTLDAYKWITTSLPKLARTKGILVDPERVVVIGWSSGGQLAMTTAWTTKSAGMKPPLAILSFYGPTDFESGDLDARRAEEYPERTMKMKNIINALPKKPLTQYDGNGTDNTGMGWVRPGDPRSELVLSLFKEGNGLPLLLNGLPRASNEQDSFEEDSEDSDSSDNDSEDEGDDIGTWLRAPDAERVAAISPLAQLRRGNYTVPTFIIHGTKDEIVPYHTAAAFVDALRAAGVEGQLLTVQGARHIHDVALKPDTKRWDETVAPGYEFLLQHLKR
ncbi:polyketide synthase [Pyrenophora tritici-repentis]|uniref:Polyketide synthase n=2 Tax=Pyrenophora tritici-repentis TaxID=45151 RepID=A0A2W1EPA2_9PLEO|nr:polyketide synthase [Pyrenophora tritici-repentis]KAF7444834.1 polyketide synthase [Pyrenophora tritici-repentis]KAI0580634.1 polyketide synthase [Pyrenophora tritici-repentis]KAI0586539.1 polyketide synthase [Pyrenophora tritici-repentis]KAI0610025.1 polyketide synthase [Pyrenophora tritici-repentis]